MRDWVRNVMRLPPQQSAPHMLDALNYMLERDREFRAMVQWPRKMISPNPGSTSTAARIRPQTGDHVMPIYQNIQVQAVQSVTNGYGFNVTDRRRHPLFTVVYANQSAAEDGRDAMIEALDRAVEVVVP
jgi:hypothetical protein